MKNRLSFFHSLCVLAGYVAGAALAPASDPPRDQEFRPAASRSSPTGAAGPAEVHRSEAGPAAPDSAAASLSGSRSASESSLERDSASVGAQAPQVRGRTPGERIAGMQGDLFTNSRFCAALGDVVFRKLLEKIDADPETAHRKWEMLSDREIPYDDINKHMTTRVLSGLVRNAKDGWERRGAQVPPALRDLWNDFLALRDAEEDIHRHRLEHNTQAYFRNLYPGCEVECGPKQAGKQLGARVRISLKNGSSLLYHVKTHAAGVQSMHSTAPENMDLREMLVYRVLSDLGIGGDAHFFWRDLKNFYVAVRDLNADGIFIEYGRLGESPVKRSALFGALAHLAPPPMASRNAAAMPQLVAEEPKGRVQLRQEEAEAWNQMIVEPDAVAQNCMHEMSKLGLLARLLLLTDLQTNSGNFGPFFPGGGGAPLLKAVDFRIVQDVAPHTDLTFPSFLAGNGRLNYTISGPGKAMSYALERPAQAAACQGGPCGRHKRAQGLFADR